jgi:hypothetical protein
MSDYLADFRKLMTGSGIGESPASQRRIVRSSLSSTSRANALAERPERSIAVRRRSAGFKQRLNVIGLPVKFAALVDEPVVCDVLFAAPSQRFGDVELGHVFEIAGGFAESFSLCGHLESSLFKSGEIALTQGNIGHIPYRAIALMQSLQSVSEDTQ